MVNQAELREEGKAKLIAGDLSSLVDPVFNLRPSDSVGRPSRRYVRRMHLRHSSSSGHRIKQERSKFKMEPVRRSTREKRLVFATLNLSEIDKQIQDPKHGYPEVDSSEVCMCVSPSLSKMTVPCSFRRRWSLMRSCSPLSVFSGSPLVYVKSIRMRKLKMEWAKKLKKRE